MKRLHEIFNNSFFRIPDYQRGYAWKCEKQIPELWDDIEEILENGNGGFRPHYTGTLFVEKMKLEDIPDTDKWRANAGATFFSVVDGQQRLTTISILLYELLKIENTEYADINIEKLWEQYIYETNASKNSRVYHFSYMGDQNPFILSQIFEDGNIILKERTENVYEKNLREAKSYFHDKIASMTKNERNILFRKITTALTFDIHEIDDGLDVQAVFETMNNRGKPLTVLEKLKNRLIYLTEKLPSCDDADKKTLRRNINNAWGRIYAELAQNPNNVLDEDDFLAAHLSLYRNPPEYVFSEKQTETKIFQMFCNKANRYCYSEGSDEKEPVVDFNKINQYVIDLSSFVSLWSYVNNPDTISIKKVFLLNSSKEVKIYLCALLKAQNGVLCEDDVHDVENILFRDGTPGAWVKDPRTFATMARDLYADSSRLGEIRNQLKADLNSPINYEAMVGEFSRLFGYVRKEIGFHRWSTLKYLLFEYESNLYGTKYSQDAQKIFIESFRNTAIEHIMPRDTTYWQQELAEFLKNIPEDSSVLAKNVLINTIGNLTILKDPKNSSVSNHPWLDDESNGLKGKKERYKTGSFSEIEISQNEHWDKNTILERGKVLLNFLLQRLGVKSTLSDDQVKRALFHSVELFDMGFKDDKNDAEATNKK